jgi:hypothetical protein
VMDVIYKYLDCGDLHQGFARVKCDDCNHEYLLPFSCKRRYFCPSCHQKRVVEALLVQLANRLLHNFLHCGIILVSILYHNDMQGGEQWKKKFIKEDPAFQC